MVDTPRIQKAKSVIIDLSRIGEWWLLVVGLVLFAFIPNIYRSNNDTITIANMVDLVFSPILYFVLVVVFSAQIFLSASNDYFDRNIDTLDYKKRIRNPVCNGKVTEREVKILLGATALTTLLFSYFLGMITFLFSALVLFVFFFYTAKPLRFKSRVGMDVISHAMFINTFPYFFCLLALWDYSSGAMFLLGVFIARSAIAQLLQEVRDYETDKKVERNTVVALGKKRAIELVFGLFMVILFSTSILLVTYQLFDFGISLFYLIVLFMCVGYIPRFHKLLNSVDETDLIESLWMGQGRTNRWSGINYAGPFGLYFCIVLFVLI
jgi:4-hydroxybenzoate polyprenyltransferase